MTDLPSKADLRRQVRERLRATSSEELAAWSQRLIARLQTRDGLWHTAGTVALFGGLRNEPDLITDLLPWLRARGWRTVLFAVEGTALHAYEVTGPQDLRRGPLGVWEPVTDLRHSIPPDELTLVLVPGLAFSRTDGSRLGRGGGFYDRFLAQPDLNARLVGICFETQIFPGIPCEGHDARVQEVLTETDGQSDGGPR